MFDQTPLFASNVFGCVQIDPTTGAPDTRLCFAYAEMWQGVLRVLTGTARGDYAYQALREAGKQTEPRSTTSVLNLCC